MPTVPNYDQRQVRDAGAPDQYQRISASPDDFGAATGRAMQGLGNDLARAGSAFSQAAEREQEKDQAARLLKAQADYSSGVNRMLYQDETLPDGTVRKGLFTTQGSEAMGSAGRFAKMEEDVFKSVTGNLSDPLLQEKFNQIRTRSRSSYETAAMKHEADNRLKFQAESQDAAVKTAALNAVNGYDKPEILNAEIDNIKRAVAASNVGSAQEVIDYKSRVAVSGVHKAIFGRMLRDDDAKAALNYYETNKGSIEGADHIEIQRALEVPLRRQRAQDYLSGVTVAGSPGTKLVRAVIGSESRGDPNAVSPVGASGLMQVMPDTAKEIDDALGSRYGLRDMSESQIQEFYKANPQVNLEHGAFYLQQNLERYNGDIEAALIAYNAGPANADKWLNAGRDYASLPKREETEPYVRKTLTRYAEEMGGPTETKPTLNDMPDLPPVGRRVTPDAFPADSYYKPEQVFRGRPGAFVDQRALTMANELGRRFEELTGRRVEMNSGFRDPGTNANVGGAKSSRHMHGDAFDFNIKDLEDKEKTAFLQLARQVGFSGVGFYEGGPGHLHLDIGRARSWGNLPAWAKGSIQETQTTGYIGQQSFAAGFKSEFGSLPMPGNMARMSSGETSPYAATAAVGMFPVTANVAPMISADEASAVPAMTPFINAPVDVPPQVSTRVRVDDFDPDAMRAYANAAPDDIRDTVMRQTEARISQMQRQRTSALKETTNAAWGYVLRDGLDKVPSALLQTILEEAPEKYKQMEEYEEGRTKRSDPNTDMRLYGELTRMRATDPKQFADLDLMDYANRLSRQHLEHFFNAQGEAVKPGKGYAAGAKLFTIDSAYNFGLAKMGIATSGKDKDLARAGEFRFRLEQQVSALQARLSRDATPDEVKKEIEYLTTPVTNNEWGTDPVKYLFELGTPEENRDRLSRNMEPVGGNLSAPVIAERFEDVPTPMIGTIERTYTALNQKKRPSPDQVRDIYNGALLASTGRNVPVPATDKEFAPVIRKAFGREPTAQELSELYSEFLRNNYPMGQ